MLGWNEPDHGGQLAARSAVESELEADARKAPASCGDRLQRFNWGTSDRTADPQGRFVGAPPRTTGTRLIP